MSKIGKKLTSKGQGLFAKLRVIRDSDKEAVVTYCFEEKKSFNDYRGNPKNFPYNVEEKGLEWKVQQPINRDIFFDSKGKFRDLEEVANIFKATAHDLGAKYFVL